MSRRQMKTEAKEAITKEQLTGMAGQTSSCLMALEPRIMYDAAGIVSLTDNVDGEMHEAVEPEVADHGLVDDVAAVVDLFSDYQLPAAVQPKELIFVDGAVGDYQPFVDGTDADTVVVMLDAGEDGVSRISEELSHYSDLDSIQIVSHGGPGSLQLGSGTLSLANLTENSAQLEGWGNALSSDGDILLYGCDVAAGVEGKSFIDQLAGLTGGDVAASIDKTGAADLGGDWDLEYQSGLVGSYIPASFAGYHGVLGDVVFVDSLQTLGTEDSEDVAVADLNGDGFLDAVVANSTGDSKVYLNDGSGNFVATADNLGIASYAAIGDVNGDGKADIFLAANGVNTLWLNDGSGGFGPTADASLGSSNSTGVALADLDGDSDLDAFVSNVSGQANRVWINSGVNTGTFVDSAQTLGAFNSWGVALADLNGDTFLDAYVVNSGQDDRVYFNNGAGGFTDSAQALGGSSSSSSVALGDVDGDGDADAFVTVNFSGANRVFLNDGTGFFTDSGQALGTSSSQEVALVDLDGDADLDAVVANPGAHKAYFNDGAGVFDTNQAFGSGESRGLAVGDFDGDGDQDVFVTNIVGAPNEVWTNDYVPEVTSGAVLNYTENDAPTAIDPTIALFDADNSSFVGATIQISSNYVESDDVLNFTPIGGITGVWNQSTATLTLSGAGSDTEYAAALASVTYENLSDSPYTAPRTVSFTVDDGMATSNVATATVNVATTNDAPVVDNSGTPALSAINEDDAASPAYSMFDFYSMFDGLMDDPDFVDTLGLAITGADNTNGNWQYSPDGGTTWNNIGAVSDTSALLLQGLPELFGKVDDTADLAANDLLINGFDVGPVSLNGGLTNGVNMQGAFNLVNSINAISGSTDVTAELETLYSGGMATDLTGNAVAESVDFDINGTPISATIPSFSSTSQVAQSVVDAIAAASLTDTHAWVGNGTNGGNVGAVVIESKGNIIVSNLIESNTGISGLVEGTYSADSSHNRGEIILRPTSASYTITTSAPNDSILALIGMDGGDVKTHIAGDTAGDGTINVTFPLNKLRFTPNADFSGTADITFRAWDQTNALPNAILADVSTNGGNTAYSSAAESISITVNPINDAPVVTSGAVLGYTENDASSVIDSAIALNDVDSANLSSAVINISANYVDGEDELVFTDTGSITGAWDAVTGTLTLTGADTVANYQTALASVEYQNVSDNPSTLARTVGFTVNDGSLNSSVATATVNVTAVNDTPVVTSAAVLGYTENDPATVIDSALTVSDVDSANLASAVINISVNYVDGEDELAFTDTGSITGAWDAVTGTLTLTGADTVANYQTALASVTYQNLSDNPSVLARTVGFTVNDGNVDSTVVTATVNVTAMNDTPVVTSAGVISYTENDPATVIDSAITVSDLDSANLASAVINISANYVDGEDVLAFTDTGSITGAWDTVTGTLTLTGADTVANYETALASVTYQNLSNNPSVLARTVGFTVNDGNVDSTVASSTVNLGGVSDIPVVTSAGVISYTENDIATVIDSAITVSDVDSANLASAEIKISANYVDGEDVLAFTDTGSITGSWDSVTGALTLTGADTVANYQTALASVTYQNGSDNPSDLARTVDFTVNDGSLDSAVATATVNVTAVNDTPVVTSAGVISYTENDPATVIDSAITVSDLDSANLASAVINISANYVDGEDVLAFTDTGSITGAWDAVTGTLTLTGADTVANYETALASVTYQNLSNNPSVLARTVGFTVNDGSVDSTVASSTVNLGGVSDTPVVTSAGVLSYTENDLATVIDSAITVSDLDSANLASAVINISANYVDGEDVLAFTDTANITGSWDAVTGTLTLTGADTVANYQTALATVTYDNLSVNPSVLARTVDFTVNDGALDSAVATSTVNVTTVNELPLVTSSGVVTYTENDSATVIDPSIVVSDPDNTNLAGAEIIVSANYVAGEDKLTFTAVGNITGSWNSTTGILTLSGADTVAKYQQALASVKYQNLSDNPSVLARTVAFKVNDGIDVSAVSTSTVNVTAVNDAPTLTSSGVLNYTENDPASVIDAGLTVGDVDNTSLSGAIVSISSGYISSEDVLEFTDTANITGSWDSSTGVISLTGTASVSEYEAALRSVTYRNLSEIPITVSRAVSFQVNDGAASTVSSATINVATDNDAPLLDNSSVFQLPEITEGNFDSAGELVSQMIGGLISDVDNDPLEGIAITAADTSHGQWQYSLDSGASWISVDAVSDNSAVLLASDSATRIRFVPDIYFYGSASISYRAWDQSVGSNGETGVDASINGGNNAFSVSEGAAFVDVSALPFIAPLDSGDSLPVSDEGAVATDSTTFWENDIFDATSEGVDSDSFELSDTVLDDALFIDDGIKLADLDNAEDGADDDEQEEIAEAEEEEEVVVVEGSEEGEVGEEVAEDQDVEEVVLEAAAATPQDEGQVVIEGQVQIQDAGARQNTTKQLAKEKGFIEAEQAEILEILGEAFELLQCD